MSDSALTSRLTAARHAVGDSGEQQRLIRTILPETWTGANPAELSVLVHEMVHHLQNLGQIKYECPAAREKPAYLAQDQFLKLHGLDLEREFEIDKFTLVAHSACMW